MKKLHTTVIAALVARMVGRRRSALGAGGGRAATWGEAAFGERLFAVGGFEGVLEGTATGSVSPKSGDGEVDFDLDELAVGGGGRS